MKTIPFTQGFQADAEGNIYDKDGNVRPQYTNGDGYKTASVKTDDDKWTTFGVQRLVALAYHTPLKEHLLMTVNHLDGNILNNTPGNLEWVTSANNIIHGTLLNRYTNRPLIIATKKNEEFYFNDLLDIARYLKTDIDTIWYRIRDKKDYDGWSIRHLKSSDARVQRMIKARPKHISEKVRKLRMLDTETKEETSFSSMHAAANHFKVGVPHIRHRISTPGFPKVFRGRYVFVDEGESLDFVTPEIVVRSQHGAAKAILVYDVRKGEFKEWKSAYKFIKAHAGSISKKAVTTRLKKGLLTETEGWIVKVITDLEKDKEAILKAARRPV